MSDYIENAQAALNRIVNEEYHPVEVRVQAAKALLDYYACSAIDKDMADVMSDWNNTRERG